MLQPHIPRHHEPCRAFALSCCLPFGDSKADMAALSLLVVSYTFTPPGFALGSAKLKQGDFASARQHFEHAAASHPEHQPTAAVLKKLDELGVTVTDEQEEDSYEAHSFSIHGHAPCIKVLTPAADSSTKPSYGDTSGNRMWTPAPALLSYLSGTETARSLVAGRRVLELGAGHGAVGISLASILGASHVTLTDLPHMLPLLRANTDANLASLELGTISVEPLVWGQTSGALFDVPWDLVCASAVCYDQELVPYLAATIRALLAARPHTTALLALSNLRHSSSSEPDYAPLLRLLAGLVRRRVASISSVSTRAALTGEIRLADANREDHTIDIFTLSSV